jgi:hypothetical protein
MADTVVGVDFPGRRATATLADLDWASLGVRFVPLIRSRPPATTNGRGYTAELLAELDVDHRDVSAVAAFCAAGPLAHEFAQLLLDATADPKPLILFDVDPCPADSVMDGFDACLRQTVHHEIRPESRRALRDAVTESPASFLALAEDALADEIQAALREEGIRDDPFADELLTSYLNYLTYLLAAHHSTRPRWGGDAYQILSRYHPDNDPWPGATRTHTLRLDVAADQIFSSPAATRAIASCLRLIETARGQSTTG